MWPVVHSPEPEVLMKAGIHTEIATFRVNDALLSAAANRARKNGMTLSEFMRAALRRELREAA